MGHIIRASGERGLVIAGQPIDASGRELARKAAYDTEAPVAMRVIGRRKHQHQITALVQGVQGPGQDIGVELRGSGQRLIR